MKKLLTIFLIAILLTGCQSVSHRRTDFPAPDKKLHYNAGYTIGMISLPVLPLGLLTGILAGGGKELYDSLGFGTPEWEDFAFSTEGSWDGYLHTWERSFYGFKRRNNATLNTKKGTKDSLCEKAKPIKHEK